MFAQLYAMNSALNRRFPGSQDPFRILARLLEECGELAEQVNIFEGSGVKRQKHGEPDRAALAKEIKQVVLCALQVAQYYQIEAELQESVESSFRQYCAEGWIK